MKDQKNYQNNIDKKIREAKRASFDVAQLNSVRKNKVLIDLAENLLNQSDKIIVANKADVHAARKAGKEESFIERLALDDGKIRAMAASLKQTAKFTDYVGQVIEEKKRPAGIIIKKVRVPLGLVAVIYESRPNVTIDAFSLAFKSANAVILKGGREIRHTNRILIAIVKQVLESHRINPGVVMDLSGLDKSAAGRLMINTDIECLIPRGGKSLIQSVRKNAKIPVIITGASVVHTYVEADANLELAARVILNAKTRRVFICNALDVLLVNEKIYKKLLGLLEKDLGDKGVEIRADKLSYNYLKNLGYKKLKRAKAADFDTEFLDYILAVKAVKNLDEALAHIAKHSLGHSEAIITRSKEKAEKFFRTIDAACLYLNTSTQFSDGGEFGLGSEIGISTQKLHARGPFSHEALTTYKYLVRSDGKIRK